MPRILVIDDDTTVRTTVRVLLEHAGYEIIEAGDGKDASRLLGRENVIAGTDCGFAQIEGLQRVHPQVMWAKFEALAAGARLASNTLWG